MTYFNRTIRIAVPIVAIAAFLAIGVWTPAIAESPSACNVPAVVARALPAIVNITVVRVITGNGEESGETAVADAKTVARGSTPTPDSSEPAAPHFETFVGSGAIINPSGIIITNKHVIKDAAVIRVMFSNRTEMPAQLIAAASLLDLAVLKVNVPEPLPTLSFGNSDALQVGQSVIAVGNPLGLGTSVSVGVVSARGRDLMRSPFDDYIQTDATINPGNSGGPLLNCDGKIVGIDTALLSNSTVLGSIGLGFALTSNDSEFVAERLVNPSSGAPNWIGMHLQNLSGRLATIFGWPDMSGAIVTSVEPGSPAAKAAVQPGDVIAGADGQGLHNASAILRFFLTRPVGEPISLLVWRDGQMENVVVRGEHWPHMMALRSDVLASPASVAQAQAAGLGLHFAATTDAAKNGGGSTPGVVVDAVTPGSQADDMGMLPGDVIERVNDKRATTPTDVMQQLVRGSSADGDLVALLDHSKTGTRWVTLYVGRVYVAGLIARPSAPGGFGLIGDETGP